MWIRITGLSSQLARSRLSASVPSLPVVPLRAYQSLARLRGRHPERALLALSFLVGERLIRPPRPSWVEQEPAVKGSASICDHTASWLCRYVSKRRPRVIVEFGS